MAKEGQLGADPEVNAVLSDRDAVQILFDPQFRKIMEECRADGSRLSFYMGIPAVRKKFQLLQKHGLISIVT